MFAEVAPPDVRPRWRRRLARYSINWRLWLVIAATGAAYQIADGLL